mmetsp:Transcript_40664/g.96577  ORF Transcript_40664/g.96577 Transcript_40664/m.96577 type:complete len:324 (-) Transcript_40664:1743-2714(-)
MPVARIRDGIAALLQQHDRRVQRRLQRPSQLSQSLTSLQVADGVGDREVNGEAARHHPAGPEDRLVKLFEHLLGNRVAHLLAQLSVPALFAMAAHQLPSLVGADAEVPVEDLGIDARLSAVRIAGIVRGLRARTSVMRRSPGIPAGIAELSVASRARHMVAAGDSFHRRIAELAWGGVEAFPLVVRGLVVVFKHLELLVERFPGLAGRRLVRQLAAAGAEAGPALARHSHREARDVRRDLDAASAAHPRTPPGCLGLVDRALGDEHLVAVDEVGFGAEKVVHGVGADGRRARLARTHQQMQPALVQPHSRVPRHAVVAGEVLA